MLVVGARLLLVPTQQGTPVRFRDGPAAVTKALSTGKGAAKHSRKPLFALSRTFGTNEKAGFAVSLGVRRPTNTCVVARREGSAAAQ